MSRLAYRRKKRFATYLDDFLRFRDMDILIVSAYADEELKAKMKELEPMHKSVSVCIFGGENRR